VFIGADRFVGKVPAGRHQGKPEFLQQQVMQRRIGQHDPQARIAGRHPVRDPRTSVPVQQCDGGGRALQQGGLLIADRAEGGDRREAGRHEGERFFLAPFARAQRKHRR
jgi:hypothetical protein